MTLRGPTEQGGLTRRPHSPKWAVEDLEDGGALLEVGTERVSAELVMLLQTRNLRLAGASPLRVRALRVRLSARSRLRARVNAAPSTDACLAARAHEVWV